MRWVPRGTVLGVAGLRILFCGGAPSFDPELRVPRLSWWPEEEIASAEVARACASGAATGGVDVLVTDALGAARLRRQPDRGSDGRRRRRHPRRYAGHQPGRVSKG